MNNPHNDIIVEVILVAGHGRCVYCGGLHKLTLQFRECSFIPSYSLIAKGEGREGGRHSQPANPDNHNARHTTRARPGGGKEGVATMARLSPKDVKCDSQYFSKFS